MNHFDAKSRERWLAFLQELDADIDPNAIRLIGKMHGVSHALYQAGEANLAAAGLSYARFRLLLNLLIGEELEGRDELNPSEISLKQGISRNTVSALIRDLERDNLIERRLDHEDRRRFNISLTNQGRSLLREYAGVHFHFIGSCFSELSAEQQASLNEILDILNEGIKRSNQCK